MVFKFTTNSSIYFVLPSQKYTSKTLAILDDVTAFWWVAFPVPFLDEIVTSATEGEGRYVFTHFCLFVCLSVCLSACVQDMCLCTKVVDGSG